MICADELRKRTQKNFEKSKKITWRNIKKKIKQANKRGEFSVSFDSEELKEFIPILEALGYTITVCKSCFILVPDYYTVSWEQPQEYWNDEKFKLG